MVFVAECDEARRSSKTRTVDVETVQMPVGAALPVAIGAFTLVTVGWTLRALLTDLRAGRGERARMSAVDRSGDASALRRGKNRPSVCKHRLEIAQA